MGFSFRLVREWGPIFYDALIITLEISVISTVFTLILGSLVASVMSLGNRLLNSILKIYVSIFRNSPLLVQLFFFFYGLPSIGIRMSSLMTGVLAITLNEGAFVTEIIRGSINGIPKNDWEAAQSLGLSQFQVVKKVVFPQAFRNAIPALTGQISMVVKDTSLFSMIMIAELTRVGNMIYNKYLDFTGFIFGAVLYIIIFIATNNISFFLEKKIPFV